MGDGASASPHAFRRALASVAGRGRAGQVEVAVPGGWIGAAVDEPGAVGRHGPVVVALDGRPSNLRALVAEQAARESGAVTPAEVVAAVFAEIGVAQGLTRLEGTFALLAVDERDGALHAVRDRVGARGLFRGRAQGGTCVASTAAAVAAAAGVARDAVDVGALQELTRAGGVTPPRALYPDVVALGPGELWAGARDLARRWWAPPELEPGRGGALVRWVQSLEYAARLCVRSASEGAGVWVEDEAGLAVLSAARHPVSGSPVAIVLDVEGEPSLAPGDARSVERVALGPADLDAALQDLADLDEPVGDPDALRWWAVARRAEALGLQAVLTGRGLESWRASAGVGRAGALGDRLRARLRLPGPARGADPGQAAGDGQRDLRHAELIGAWAGLRMVNPLGDPRLVQLGRSVPLGHHGELEAGLIRALSAPSSGGPPAAAGSRGPLPALPIGRWLAASGITRDLPARLARWIEPASVTPLLEAMAGSTAAARQAFALVAIERWLRGR